MLTSRSSRLSRKRSHPARIEIARMIGAGAPPSRTIARTRARKLPEIFRRDWVSIDITSLKIEKPSRMPNRARSQLAYGARQIARPTSAARTLTSRAWLNLVGRSFCMGSGGRGAGPAQAQGGFARDGRFLRPTARFVATATCGIKVVARDAPGNPPRPPGQDLAICGKTVLSSPERTKGALWQIGRASCRERV